MKKCTMWLLVGTLLIVLTLVVGCGGGEPAPAPTPAPTPAPAPAPAPAPTPAPEPAPAPTPAPTPTSTPAMTPHTLEGRDNCLMCHETGMGDAAKIPADHSGRANETCSTCHKPAA